MSTQVKIKATNVLRRINSAKDTRVLLLQGGARSSKTYSVCQYIILQCLQKKTIVTIARGKLTWLRTTAMIDFFEVLETFEEYNPAGHNKSNYTYTFSNGSEILFTGLDESQKLRGRKQDIAWVNEANESSYEDFRQIIMRTKGQVILDFNPSEEFHWIYDKVQTREDCAFIQSTYKDNPYLDAELIKEIESLQTTDPDYWSVFGLGERGHSKELIYNYSLFSEMPQGVNVSYGLDFGYQHPTALIECGYIDGALYWREIIYNKYLSVGELVALMKDKGISNRASIYADSARPDIIKEIQKAGFNIQGATKRVYEDISLIKGQGLHIHRDSANLIKEANNYKWKRHTATNEILDEPVKFMDDAIDAARYGSIPLITKPKGTLRASF